MNFRGEEWRARRNLLNQGVAFTPIHCSLANYSTNTNTERKAEMKPSIVQEDLFTRLHSIPDPLRKNLADTFMIGKEIKVEKLKMSPVEEFHYENDMDINIKPTEEENSHGTDSHPSLASITGFFSSFFGIISGAMFHKRPKSPVSQYHDCFDNNTDMSHEGSPSFSWHTPNYQDQNKNQRAHIQFCTGQPNDSMNNCRTAVAQCEGKLNAVRGLLTSKTATGTPKFRPRRPRRVFVEPGSIEEQYEDAFTPEDFVSLASDDYIEYINIPKSFEQEFCKVDAPLLKTGFGTVQESTDIVKNVDNVKENSDNASDIEKKGLDETAIRENIKNRAEVENIDSKIQEKNIPIEISTTSLSNTDNAEVTSTNKEVISSCEDKIAKLKLMLQEKRKKSSSTHQNSTDSLPELVIEESIVEDPKKSSKTIPIEKKPDRRFKNPNRLHTDKRRKTRMRKNIQDDMIFAHEIDSEDISSSADNSPRIPATKSKSEPILGTTKSKSEPMLEIKNKDYFDEVKGRFHSSSTTESEDSFQIVFSDSPKLSRLRRPSDCDSEDSFIIFEDSPDSCYTSNDVFRDESDLSDEEYTDSESDVSDSGCVSEICKLSHSFSRTVGDLTDPTLYEDVKDSTDDVDCAIRTVGEVLPSESVSDSVATDDVETATVEDKKMGLLIDEAKKLQRKGQPAKKVRFSDKPPKVHVMRVWAFAARQARAGHWERHALDRERFKRRIADVEVAVSWVLKPQHRSRVMFQRFMPWWNAQRRKEIAERKQKEEEEKIKREEDELRRKREEEERIKKEEEERLKREEEAKLKAEADKIEEEKRIEKNRQKNCKVTKYVYENGKYSRVCPTKQQINNEIDTDDGNYKVAQNNDSEYDINKTDKITDVNLIDANNKVENITGIV